MVIIILLIVLKILKKNNKNALFEKNVVYSK